MLEQADQNRFVRLAGDVGVGTEVERLGCRVPSGTAVAFRPTMSSSRN